MYYSTDLQVYFSRKFRFKNLDFCSCSPSLFSCFCLIIVQILQLAYLGITLLSRTDQSFQCHRSNHGEQGHLIKLTNSYFLPYFADEGQGHPPTSLFLYLNFSSSLFSKISHNLLYFSLFYYINICLGYYLIQNIRCRKFSAEWIY